MNAERISATLTAGAIRARTKPRYDINNPEIPETHGFEAVYNERTLADQYAGTRHSCYDDEPGASQYAEFEHMYY